MKKLLFYTLLLSTLNAHECNYKLKIDLDMDNGLLSGHATISSDHPSMKLLDSKANILNIKNATLNISENKPQIIMQDVNKPAEIFFSHNFKQINGDAILLDAWYPKIDMMCKYETTISNSDATTILEATKILNNKDSKTYIFDRPLDSLHLITSKNYSINSKKADNGMTLSTYLYKKDSYLSNTYMTKVEDYFNIYKKIFGFLPYNNFSVVETPFPAGYSMPTYTLIGQQIIGKDFVLDNSLGHEIAHQWFGGYIYAPYQGNWLEGITTYYSDYLYAKNRGEAAKYRKNILIKYNSFIGSNNETALIEFKYKGKESNNVIGYGKAAFFFYMLEQKIGEEAFNRGIKLLMQNYPYKVASYKNLREIFEKASNQKLLDFFKTWVYKKSALDFKISDAKLMFKEDKYILEFNCINNIKSGYLPLSICSADNECLSRKIDLSKAKQHFELDIEPTKMIVDKNYDIFRKLAIKEIPPVISKIMLGNAIVVLNKEDENKFSEFKNIFKDFKYSDEIEYKDLKNNNLIILGSNNSLLNQIALSFKMQGDTKIELYKNPLNGDNVIAVFDTKKLSRTFFYKLKHLGKYSTVVFEDEKIIQKSTKESDKGVIFTINSGSYAIKPKPHKLNEVVKEIAKSKIVFIGEKHTEFSSHLNQLKIIKEMYKKNKELAIGMEMFQKPYQKYLDSFIAGKISEKEMLKKTEYFKRWKYDYELYRPIILFAKKKQIPIIALNIDREITKKVVSEGIDSLSDEQKEEIPKSINFENDEYKGQLKMIFGMHHSKRFKTFDEFYHAQLIWDESMASNIVKFMKKNPNYSMAVLAGNGHIMHGHGIPSRIERRGITEYTIALNHTDPKPGIADYLLYPSYITTQSAKKIGVHLDDDTTLKVKKLVENSPAQKAKIEVGDTITAFNGTAVQNLAELKTELAFASNSATLTVIRGLRTIDLIVDFSE